MLLKKIILLKIEKKIIIPYSLKKIKIKPTDENSTLNPLINSLSPSAKSKGARLHSIKHLTHQNKKINKSNPKIILLKEKKFIDIIKQKGTNKMKFILISYLTV